MGCMYSVLQVSSFCELSPILDRGFRNAGAFESFLLRITLTRITVRNPNKLIGSSGLNFDGIDTMVCWFAIRLSGHVLLSSQD